MDSEELLDKLFASIAVNVAGRLIGKAIDSLGQTSPYKGRDVYLTGAGNPHERPNLIDVLGGWER